MFCRYCGNKVDEYADKCHVCGASTGVANTTCVNDNDVPAEYKPMGAWSYFGHSLLFSIPVVGIVLLIVFSCGATGNINKRNYARSYFCGMALSAIILLIMFIISLISGVGFLTMLESMY